MFTAPALAQHLERINGGGGLLKDLEIRLDEEDESLCTADNNKFCLDSYRAFGKANCTSTKGGQRYNNINLMLSDSFSSLCDANAVEQVLLDTNEKDLLMN